MNSYALISLTDKSGAVEFARFLEQRGVKILSTGNTAEVLRDSGVAVTAVSEYTGQPEIMDGRVKTLTPKIHGGILARRDSAQHMQDLQALDAGPIDYVIVNLYPFLQKVRETINAGDPEHQSLIEFIDIGGPAMLRAAAKNFKDVVVLIDPKDYPRVQLELSSGGKISLELRRELAAKVFTFTAAYDGAIARYLSLNEKLVNAEGKAMTLGGVENFTLKQSQALRYGENPHQLAALYEIANTTSAPELKQLQGKELSYNNLLDADAAWQLARELNQVAASEPSIAIIKHLNPCGVACGKTLLEAFQAARACDPVSAFGGIIATTSTLDALTAQAIIEGFVEVIIAPKFAPQALEVLAQKKNVRVLQITDQLYSQGELTPRLVFGRILLQENDAALVDLTQARQVTKRKPKPQELTDLSLAWVVCKHVKSNAIVIAKDGKAIGIGAGQMSRVDSSRLAIERAQAQGFDVQDAAAASDAFLPFSDTLEYLAAAGIKSLVQPGGSIKDEDVICRADELDVAMVFTGERHFRH
ncbi:bifunctional phosphoribosylaminoimidazolecarboxamide formyltransferase/IMP cyclohydrolase [bacterium]|nr:bifunctional phosphoribosylaminoimidazolecarboxamide formyltransferase/IMP cyclohydrolase [bacterium]